MAHARREAAEELVTVVAHDLRNFLSPLSLRLEVIRHRAEGEQRAEDLRDAQAASRTIGRLGQLVNDLLDVTRIDQGVFHLQPQLIDLGALTAEIAATLESQEHPILVRVQEGGRILVAADPARMRQCLENLIANAVQQSPRGSAVSIFVKLRKASATTTRCWSRSSTRGRASRRRCCRAFSTATSPARAAAAAWAWGSTSPSASPPCTAAT